MISDLIHMTQGELLIAYWWLWLAIASVAFGFAFYLRGR